jgi:DNA polymerase-3 subunit beta
MTTATKERKKRAGGISLPAQELKAALNAVGQAVPTRSPRPIYQSVLLSGGVLSGSDGDVRIDVTLENAPPGINFLLPKDRFSAILGSFTGDEITITPDDTSCVIKARTAEWTLPTEDASEYPAWDVVGAKPITRMPADQFVRAVKGVVFAADNESSRYALGAVLIEVQGDSVSFVATDGRRLACVTCERRQVESTDDTKTLVPYGALSKCLKLLPKKKNSKRAEDEDNDNPAEYDCGTLAVQIEATSKEVVFTIGPIANDAVQPAKVVTARLLDGRFPRWRDTIPERSAAKATTVSRENLLSATRAAAICTSDESKGVQFTFSDEGIWLHGQSSEKGESSVTCDVVEAGDKATVKLDPSYLQQWLNGIDSESQPHVDVEVVDADSAVILRCGDSTGVIMPMADQ